MEQYVNGLNENGSLFITGFYLEDLDVLKQKAESLNLKFDHYRTKNNWVAAQFIKK